MKTIYHMDKENLHGQMAEFIKGYTLMVKERVQDKSNCQMARLLQLISKMESLLVWLFMNLIQKRKTISNAKPLKAIAHYDKQTTKIQHRQCIACRDNVKWQPQFFGVQSCRLMICGSYFKKTRKNMDNRKLLTNISKQEQSKHNK